MSIHPLGSDVNMSYPIGGMSGSPQIEVIAATREQMPVIDNLIQLYAHDFSEFHNIELESNGRFEYTPLPLYWTDPNRHPFLVKADGKLAGFVLVKHEAGMWDVAEFFVVRAWRRHGIGTAIAHDVWKRFPGPWEVRVMQANQAALPFWERAISAFTGTTVAPTRLEKEGKLWHLFSFDSPLAPTPLRSRFGNAL
jgi:predicted acetyltransferase